MPLLVIGLGLALCALLVGASLAAAVDPLAPLLTVAVAYAGGLALFRGDRARELLAYGVGFVALVTIPLGLLTHGTLTDLGPYPAEPFDGDLSGRTETDRVPHAGGALIAYAATGDAPPVLAFERGGTTEWASALPTDRNITALREMTVFPLLWRIRVDLYAEGWDAPGWLYVWRWGGVQELYVLRD